MSVAGSRSDTVPVQLPNGATVKFEVSQTGREDDSFDPKQFQPIPMRFSAGEATPTRGSCK